MYHSKGKEQFESDSIRRNGYEPLAQYSQTAPDYLAHEAKDRRLLNDNYEVEWPNRPQFDGYAEESNENNLSSRIKRSSKGSHQQHRSKDKICMDKVYPQKTEGHMTSTPRNYPTEKARSDEIIENNEDDNYLFVGAQTISAVSKLLRQNDFRLYYQIPSSNENAIPIRIPLCLAYMSAVGKIYHFPIACTIDKWTGRESWRVLYGDPRPSSFATLSALVKYHKIYSYMDPKTGAIDTFPVWKGAIIDFDEID